MTIKSLLSVFFFIFFSMATTAYAGSETGNVLIPDTLDNDPTNYMRLKGDRAGRIRYPSFVGNTFKNVTEQVYSSAGGTLPVAQFMTGRATFTNANPGAVTLPTAVLIVQLLQTYYRQMLSQSTIFTNSNSIPNRISNEIDVEFYNASGNPMTLVMGAGITFVGQASGLTIPANTIQAYKFQIVTTNPAAINMFPRVGAGGSTVVTLAAQAPTQLVDYNTTTGQLGYVNDAVLAPAALGDVLIGWNAATSTISRRGVALGAPQALLTRNATTGEFVHSLTANFVTGAVTGLPVQVNATSGAIELRPTDVPLHRYADANQVLGAGAADVTILFNGLPATPGTPAFTYAAGQFTSTPGTLGYGILCTITTSAAAPDTYFSIWLGTIGAGIEYKRTPVYALDNCYTLSAFISAPAQGNAFYITGTSTSGATVSGAAGITGTITDISMMRLN